MMEWVIIGILAVTSTLFAVGGTGFKWVRRYVLPGLLALGLILLGGLWWKVLIACGALCGALHLGYGESKTYWYKFLVGCAYVVPSLLLGFSLWAILTPILFVGLFKLSNWEWTAGDFTWKICEFIFGLLIGATYIVAVLS